MPNSEAAVYDRLRFMHHELYYPRIKVQRRHAGRVDWAYRPFLPRYMFVRDDGRGVSDIKRTFGVCDVVRAGLNPVRIPSGEIDKLRVREIDGFIQLDQIVPKSFRPGEMLRATAGPLVDRDVIFGQMTGATRAVIFFDAVIGRIMAEVDTSTLERVRVVQSAA